MRAWLSRSGCLAHSSRAQLTDHNSHRWLWLFWFNRGTLLGRQPRQSSWSFTANEMLFESCALRACVIPPACLCHRSCLHVSSLLPVCVIAPACLCDPACLPVSSLLPTMIVECACLPPRYGRLRTAVEIGDLDTVVWLIERKGAD